MHLEYNTQLEAVKIKEYGRNIQRMIAHCLTIQDRDERNLAAHNIVDVMLNINPDTSKSSDYKHKLWDHLHIMADYQLDVDSPYEKPILLEMQERPQLPAYNNGRIKHRHYGKNIGKMIKIACEEEDPEKKAKMTEFTASYMMLSYKTWNEEKVAEEVIIANLSEMSQRNLKLDKVVDLSTYLSQHPTNSMPSTRRAIPVRKKKRKRR